MALTAKMERFCLEYIKDLNATQAAIRAGYSEKTAYSIGGENLSKPEIVSFLAKIQAPIAEAAIVDATFVLTSLKKIANDMLAGDTPSHAQAASRALELLGKHLVLFADRVIVEDKTDDLDELKAAAEFLKANGVQISQPKTIQ